MTELVKYEPKDLELSREPDEVLKEAKKAAQALTQVVASKPKKLIFNGQQYFEVSDWQLLGKFYGMTGKITETRPVQFGEVRGWEAHAIVLNRAGQEISAADGMCLNDEEKWATKPKYEYLYILKDGTKQKENPPKNKIVWVDNPKNPGKKMPKTERVKIGEDPVPFFQLRSMAQTRALSKVLRNVLSWVVVLAGYQPSSVDDIGGPEEIGEEPEGENPPATATAAGKTEEKKKGPEAPPLDRLAALKIEMPDLYEEAKKVEGMKEDPTTENAALDLINRANAIWKERNKGK